MESIRCDKSTTGLDEKESTPPSPNSSCLHQQQSANAVVASFKQGLPPIKECPVVESMQYAFGPDGTLTTGPILRTDPQTGLIIYSTCWNQKPDTAFQVTGPHRFMNPMCSDCQSVSLTSAALDELLTC
jgi:hypothetical protein